MASQKATRWQFSLRALLFVVLLCAVLSFTWRVLGTSRFFAVTFVLSSVAACVALAGRGRRAYLLPYLLAYSALYGPFFVMAIYTYFFVACAHCKATTWSLLPYGPGILLVDFGYRLLTWSRLQDSFLFGFSLLMSAALVMGLTWLLKRIDRRWWPVSLTAAVSFCSWCAYVLLALIRA